MQMIEEYKYQERQIMRFYIWFIFTIGSILVFTMLGLILSDLITSQKREDIEALLTVAMVGGIWIIIFSYFISNSPQAVVLTDRVMQVNWNIKKRKEYLWQDVALKKTGLQDFVLILVHDSTWFIPRWVLLDGSSKQYKELISRIKKIKHLSEIEQL